MARDETAVVQLQVRLREDLRRRLEEAARARRVSLNQEIVDRLSYVRDRVDLLPEILRLSFGAELAGIIMMIAPVMRVAGWKGKDAATTEDIDDAIRAANVLFEALRPNSKLPIRADDLPSMLALSMLRGIIDPEYPDRFSDRDLQAIRDLLPNVVARWKGLPEPKPAKAPNPLRTRSAVGMLMRGPRDPGTGEFKLSKARSVHKKASRR